jgi:hypothetical protein
MVLLTAFLAFVTGAGLAGWLVWSGDLDPILPEHRHEQAAVSRIAGNPDAAPSAVSAQSAAAPGATAPDASLGGVETRLALLEDRFTRIDQQARAASANASRAEALLIALATRRMIDKGQPLGYLENQLKLRFGGAQPQAVQTIINTARNPITLYQLSSRLDADARALSGERRNEGTWAKISREVSSLFVVRRSSTMATKPLDRALRAQVLLKAGQIDEAIAEVERLPGADDAQDWIAAARRYAEAQRALEIIETAAMLEPRELRDGQGLAVNQPSPVAPPAEKAATVN